MTLMTRSFFLITILTVLAGCSTAPPTTPPIAQKASSVSQSPIVVANRIVSLNSLSTDIISQLNKNKLVGITGSKLLDQNPDLKDLPRVAEGRTPPNLEKIVALKPDLVIGSEGFHDQALNQLKSMGIKTLTTTNTDFAALKDLTQTLATATGSDPGLLLKRYDSWTKPRSNPVSVLVIAGYQPILSPNKTSWAGDMLQRSSLTNLTADLQGESPQRGFVTLSPEKILEVNPDRLILVDTGDGTVEKYKASPFWSQLRAVQTNQIHTFDYYGLVNPGSLDSIEKAYQKLNSEI